MSYTSLVPMQLHKASYYNKDYSDLLAFITFQILIFNTHFFLYILCCNITYCTDPLLNNPALFGCKTFLDTQRAGTGVCLLLSRQNTHAGGNKDTNDGIFSYNLQTKGVLSGQYFLLRLSSNCIVLLLDYLILASSFTIKIK